MKYLKTFKLFEGKNYAPEDIVTIRYWLTGDIIPVKIKKVINNNQYLVSFKTENNPLQNAPDLIIKKGEIIGNYALTNDPVSFRNPMNVPSEFIRRDSIKISNDIAINGYPKTLA